MKYFLMLSVLLLGASWTAAQTYPSQSPSESNSSHSARTSAGDQMSVEGCLSGSDGNYTLTDKKGMTYQLTGDTAKLAEHVGHEIKVTGTSSSAAASGASSGTMGKSETGKEITVSSFKHISKTCQSGGMSH